MTEFLLLVMWAGCCVLVGWLAERRGRSATGWVALVLVLGFLFFFSVLLYDEQHPQYSADGMSTRLDAWPAAAGAAFLAPWMPFILIALLPNRNRKCCPDCGEAVVARARICRFCRHAFEENQ